MGNATVKLTEAYRFCWAVERAVQIAYKTRISGNEDHTWLQDIMVDNVWSVEFQECHSSMGQQEVHEALPSSATNWVNNIGKQITGNNGLHCYTSSDTHMEHHSPVVSLSGGHCYSFFPNRSIHCM